MNGRPRGVLLFAGATVLTGGLLIVAPAAAQAPPVRIDFEGVLSKAGAHAFTSSRAWGAGPCGFRSEPFQNGYGEPAGPGVIVVFAGRARTASPRGLRRRVVTEWIDRHACTNDATEPAAGPTRSAAAAAASERG